YGARRRTRPMRARRSDLRFGRRAVRESALPAAGVARDRRQGADRRHRRLYGDLLVRGLQRLRAAEDVPHLGSRVPRKSDFAGSREIAGSHHQSCSNRKAASRPSAARGDKGEEKEWVMVTIRKEMPFDLDARDDLLDRVWGLSRFQKTAERLREG